MLIRVPQDVMQDVFRAVRDECQEDVRVKYESYTNNLNKAYRGSGIGDLSPEELRNCPLGEKIHFEEAWVWSKCLVFVCPPPSTPL